jgi:hypothetical protein
MDGLRLWLSKDGRFSTASRFSIPPIIKHKQPCEIAALTIHFNPQKSVKRSNFISIMKKQFEYLGIDLFVAEGSFNGEFESQENNNTFHITYDPQSYMWIKENMINIATRKIANLGRYKYILWIDADAIITSEDFRDKILETMMTCDIAQACKMLYYIRRDNSIDPRPWVSFSYLYSSQQTFYEFKKYHWFPGLAWVAKIETMLKINGLYDGVITGGGDNAFLMAMYPHKIGRQAFNHLSQLLVDDMMKYAENVKKVKPKLGFVNEVMMHMFHGKMENRRYYNRHEPLRIHNFNPTTHLEYDSNGTLKWSSETPKEIIEGLREYIIGRNDDE